jgi:hypothetical protein
MIIRMFISTSPIKICYTPPLLMTVAQCAKMGQYCLVGHSFMRRLARQQSASIGTLNARCATLADE